MKIHNYLILSTQNKKKSGSNDENLRKLKPQLKQRVLIKKMSVMKFKHGTK